MRDDDLTADPDFRTPNGETWEEFASRLGHAGEGVYRAFSSARNGYWRERKRLGLTTWAQCTEKAIAEFPASKYPVFPGRRPRPSTTPLPLLTETEAAMLEAREAEGKDDGGPRLLAWLFESIDDAGVTVVKAPSRGAWSLLRRLRLWDAMRTNFYRKLLDCMFKRAATGDSHRERRADGDERIPDTADIEATIDAVVEDLKKSGLTATQPQ